MSMEETTLSNEDVEPDVKESEPKAPEYDVSANPRDAIEDELAAKRLNEIESESDGEFSEAQDDEELQADSETESPPRDGRPEVRDSKPATESSSTGDKSRKLKLVVNGETKELTEAEVIALAQKSDSADRRFQDAAAALRQANEIKVRLEQQQQAPQEAVQQQPQQASTTDDDALVQALMYGEEADVRNVVATLRNGNNGQQASPQQMAMMAAKIAQEQLAQQQVLNNALDEYPEVKNDPILQQVAGRFYLDEVKQDLMSLGYTEQQLNAAPVQQWNERHAEARAKNYGSVRSYDQLLRNAGAKARDWKTGSSATPTDGLAEKQSRKAGVAKQPRSISAATPNRGEPRPLTQADIIREEREARNLPVY